MKISNNNNNINFKSANLSKLAQPLSVFYDKNSVIPTLLIETGVTIGRTIEANKTGGKKEAIERFVEQGVSAVVWLWGVQLTNKAMTSVAELFKKNISKNENFKAGTMLASLGIATFFIGFILPKINHFISKKIMEKSKNKENKENKKANNSLNIISMEEYKKQTKKESKNISFSSLASVASAFENNNTLRLLVTDTGVIAGRYKNGRNKYEKIEGLFRDIASIYFYLRATNDFVKLSSKLLNTDLISKEKLQELLKNPNIATKADNKAIRTTFGLYAAGTALSTFALGILIPKVQYLLRKKLTNSNQFPGDDGYKANNQKNI